MLTNFFFVHFPIVFSVNIYRHSLLRNLAKEHKKRTKGTLTSPLFMRYDALRARRQKCLVLSDRQCECVTKLFESAKYKALKDAKKLVFPCIVLTLLLYIVDCSTLANP